MKDRIDELIEKATGVRIDPGDLTELWDAQSNKLRAVAEAAFEAGGASDGWWKEKIRRQFAKEALEKWGQIKVSWPDHKCERVLFDWLREQAGENE